MIKFESGFISILYWSVKYSVTTSFKHLCLNGSNLTSPVSKVILGLSDKRLKLSENEDRFDEKWVEEEKDQNMKLYTIC